MSPKKKTASVSSFIKKVGVNNGGKHARKRKKVHNQESQGQRQNVKGFKKRKWFKTQKYKNILKSNSMSSEKLCTSSEKEANKPFLKTVATLCKTNPSSNWQNLLQVLNIERTSNKKATSEFMRQGKTGFGDERKNKEQVTTNSSSSNHRTKTQHQKLEVWFDDVDEELLKLNEISTTQNVQATKPTDSSTDHCLVKPGTYSGCTKIVAMDCEMVGVGEGGKENELARVSIVNRIGHCIYDKFVKPREEVVDYRTYVSGVRPSDLENAEEFSTVQREVYNIIKGRILVGHAIRNDLQVLYLSHPKSKIRDTSRYKPFRQLFNGRTPSLKKLSERLLGVQVQTGEHNSVQDAQAAMRLYTMHKNVWERELKSKQERNNTAQQKESSMKNSTERDS